jgi:hypothetical protein
VMPLFVKNRKQRCINKKYHTTNLLQCLAMVFFFYASGLVLQRMETTMAHVVSNTNLQCEERMKKEKGHASL